MHQNPEYIKSIVSKLERLNMVDHGSKDPLTKQQTTGTIQGEIKAENIMDWMGRTALEYLNKKNSNEGLLS